MKAAVQSSTVYFSFKIWLTKTQIWSICFQIKATNFILQLCQRTVKRQVGWGVSVLTPRPYELQRFAFSNSFPSDTKNQTETRRGWAVREAGVRPNGMSAFSTRILSGSRLCSKFSFLPADLARVLWMGRSIYLFLFFFHSFVKIYLFLLEKQRVTGRRKSVRERDHPVVGSLPKWLQWPVQSLGAGASNWSPTWV